MPNTLTRTFILRLAILFLVSFLAAASTSAQQTPATRVQIIPQPRQWTATQDKFRFGSGASIALADPHSEDDRFAAQDFIDDAKETAGVGLKIGKGRARQSIVIGTIDLPLVQSALKRAGMESPANLDAEGYVLGVTSQEIVIGGKTSAGVFYGLQTLKQLVRGESSEAFIQGIKITDWPAMRWRGVSDDISRGPMPTVDYIKRQLRTFAAFKLIRKSLAWARGPLTGDSGRRSCSCLQAPPE